MTHIDRDRRYFQPPPQMFERTYVLNEDALPILRVLGHVIFMGEKSRIEEEANPGEVVLLNGTLWKKSEREAEVVYSDIRLMTTLSNAEWYLHQAEEQGAVGFGVERDNNPSVIVTRGVLDQQYNIWVPLVDSTTDEDERMISSFERSKNAGETETALDLLHQIQDKYVRLIVDCEDQNYTITAQGIRSLT